MWRGFICFCSVFSLMNSSLSLCAQEPIEALSLFEGDQSGIVFQCIDAISGAYKEQEDDFATASISPIVASRSYSSSSGLWRFFPHCALYVGGGKALTAEPYGTPLVYREGPNSIWKIQDAENPGLTNSSEASSAATNNLKNNTLQMTKTEFLLTTSDGTLRKYEKSPTSNLGRLCVAFPQSVIEGLACWRLVQEILPCGNHYVYHYDSKGLLVRIEAVNTTWKRVLAFVDMEYQDGGITLRANDTQLIHYSFKDGLLEKVYGTSQVPVQYEYTSVGQTPRLCKKTLPAGRFIVLNYTPDGKVSQLRLALPEKPFYTFSYGPSSTTVLDVDGNKTVYHHKNSRLRVRETWNGDQLYCTEKLVWRHMDSADETGILLERTLADSANTIASKKVFNYDTSGNLINTGDSRKFSQDRFCSLIEEKSPFGMLTRYSYKDGTNLVAKKLCLTPEGKMAERHFYFYNDDAALVKEITDDGDKEDPNDLTGAKERLIREIQPRSTAYEKEEIINEKYWTHGSQAEKLVRRTRLIINPLGQITKRELYGSDSNLAKTESFEYNYHGNCLRKINPLGAVIEQVFDANDNLKEVRELQTGKVTKFYYDINDRLLVTSELTPDGCLNRIAVEYDAKGNKIAETDRLGRRTTFVYDFLSRLTAIQHPKVLDEKGVPVQPEEKRSYDLLGNFITKTDPKGYVDRYTYVGENKIANITYSDETKECYGYNPNGSLKVHVARNGMLTLYEYDWQGRAIKETHPQVCAPDPLTTIYEFSTFHLEKVCNAINAYTIYSYDDYGRLKSEICPSQLKSIVDDPHSQRTDYEYDSQGRLGRIKKWTQENDFFFEVMRYDALDRIIETWKEQADGMIFQRMRMTYDAAGNIIRKEQGATFEETTYDGFGRPTAIKNSQGLMIAIKYDENHTDEFGARCLIKKMIANPGQTTTICYDAHDRARGMMKTDILGTLFERAESFYDLNGNLSARNDYIVPHVSDRPEYVRTEWIYGPKNRLDVLREAANSSCTRVSNYTYDALLQLKTLSITQNQTTKNYKFDYTKLGLLEKADCDSDWRRYDYDGLGRILEALANWNYRVKREYTTFGEIASERMFREGGNDSLSGKDEKYKLKFEYDRIGRPLKIILPDDSSMEYHYHGLLLTTVFRWDKTGKIIYQHAVQQYDDQAHIVREKLIGKVGSRQTHYEADRPTKLAYDSFEEEFLYTDINERKTKIVKGNEEGIFLYDPLNRLENDPSKNGTHYIYDSLDNLIYDGTSHYAYNDLNQLLSDGQFSYEYDAEGNLSEILRGDKTKLKVYNDFGQPSGYDCEVLGRDCDPIKQRNRRDAYGRCVCLSEQSREERWVFYFGSEEIGSVNDKKEILELKVPLSLTPSMSSPPIAIEQKQKVYFPVTDIQNSIVKLVDIATSKIVESYQYYPFGERSVYDEKGVLQNFPSDINPWGWKSLHHDFTSGFIWMGARTYDPKTHRFITCDPAGFLDGVNRYTYAGNDPINFGDPTGLSRVVEPCLCHPDTCEYYFTNPPRCGHGGSIIDDDDLPSRDTAPSRFFRESKKVVQEAIAIGKKKPTFDKPGTERNYSEKSRPYKVAGTELSRGGIIYVNGIQNTFAEAQAAASHLSQLGHGVSIQGVYTASGGFGSDLKECVLNTENIVTQPGIILRDMLKQMASNPDPTVKYLIISHSRGSIVTDNALLGLSRAERKKFIVVSIAPGRCISKNDCFHVDHYISPRDFVPYLYLPGFVNALFEGTVHYVWPGKGAPVWDHPFLSSTYEGKLQKHMDDYLQKYGGL